MGYTTDFKGSLTLSKPLTEEQLKWYNDWKSIRKCSRDSQKLMEEYKGKYSLDGDYGVDGEFFGYVPKKYLDENGDGIWYDENGDYIRDIDSYSGWIGGDSVKQFSINPNFGYNPNQPKGSNWCRWKIEGNQLLWDGREKFYNYVEWLEYINKNIFSKWDITFTDQTEIKWSGEDVEDCGVIYIEDGWIYDKRWGW